MGPGGRGGRVFFKIWAYPGLFFVYFCPFHITIQLQIEKSIDGVLRIQTWGRRMVGADEITEIWLPPGGEELDSNIAMYPIRKILIRAILGSIPGGFGIGYLTICTASPTIVSRIE